MKRIPLIMAVGALLLVLSAGVALAHVVFINCDGGPCNGTKHENFIDGTERRDVIEAKAGEDEVWAYGSERSGEDARDVIYGQGDADEIHSGRDNDYVSGGSGNDRIFDEAGPLGNDESDEDEVYGDSGNDRINVRDGDGLDYVNCGRGSDDVVVRDDGDEADNCERRRDSLDSASADSATVSAQQYGGETTETSS